MKILVIIIILLISFPVFSEKIVTQKSDEPDGYYGLQIGGVLSPSFGYRYRDNASGESNTTPNDRTGFSLPWTLLTIDKKWEEQGIEAELWFELIRAGTFSADTVATNSPFNEPRRSDPYTLGIRRGNIKKVFQSDTILHKIIFGIQEMPSTFTQWNESWDWRYMDTAPMESLGFFNAPADIGLSYLMEVSILQFQVGLANGEGYRSIQNAESSGIDGFGRVSVLPRLDDWVFGIHLIGRAKNWVGLAGNECLEGRTDCVPTDFDRDTFLEKDLRARKGETVGLEWTVDEPKFLHFGLGYIWRRDYGGAVRDRLNTDRPIQYEKDRFGRSFYAWLGLGYENFWVVFRGEKSTGSSGILEANHEERDEILRRFQNPDDISSEYLFSNKSYFVRRSTIIEYRFTDNFRIAVAGSEIVNYDSNGERENVYVNQVGEESSKLQFRRQFTERENLGIREFARINRQLYVRATYIF